MIFQEKKNTNNTTPEPITMSFLSNVRTRYLAWSNSTPLPDLADTPPPVFQRWHAFDKASCKWVQVQTIHADERALSRGLRLVTWNVDAFGDSHESRMDGILSKLQQMLADDNGPDVVFFQEVSRKALAHLLQSGCFREQWVSSEADETNWADVPFATMTLLSRASFEALSDTHANRPGSTNASTADAGSRVWPVWRVEYPSRFKRDALCCDIFWDTETRIRLINVHLDSLPIQPNQRPRQVAIAANFLRTAGMGRGVITGDWNPVSEEDTALVEENGLVDAWEILRPGEDGYTWGLDGKSEPFPPGRLDKVAVLGLKPLDIKVLHPQKLSVDHGSGGEMTAGNGEEGVPWSDHSGLFCSFVIDDATG